VDVVLFLLSIFYFIGQRRTAIRQAVPTKVSVEAETSTIIYEMLFLVNFILN